jgi:hypothetical protein
MPSAHRLLACLVLTVFHGLLRLAGESVLEAVPLAGAVCTQVVVSCLCARDSGNLVAARAICAFHARASVAALRRHGALGGVVRSLLLFSIAHGPSLATLACSLGPEHLSRELTIGILRSVSVIEGLLTASTAAESVFLAKPPSAAGLAVLIGSHLFSRSVFILHR